MQIIPPVLARQFGVSDSFAIKLMARRKMTGDIKPARQGRPEGTGKLAPYRSYLLAPVQGQPDISLAELCPRLEAGHGIKTYTGPIWADLGRSGPMSTFLRKAGSL